MSVTLNLDHEIENRLLDESRRSGETVDAVVARILDSSLPTSQPVKRFVVKPFSLEIPEKWKGLTPSQIDYEMEIEHYEETLERTRRESADIRT